MYSLISIQVQPEKDTVKPGEKVPVTVSINGMDQQPVANAEVTLCAVDEAVLSLTNYKTPQPLSFFHEPAGLAVNNSSSFFSLLPEDAKERVRGNKGIVIGGGGEQDELQLETRKNFMATPLWLSTAVTDSDGKISTSFTAPDNLTRYRIMAVASEGAARFGSAESPVIVNKPLMIDPVVPRFARVNDEFLVKALVHNTTPHSGTVTVTLTLDSKADFITEQKPFILISSQPAESKPEGKTWARQLALKAGQSVTLSYPVKLNKLGDTDWNWSVQTDQWPNGIALDDATVSHLKVEHPMSQLRDVRYFALDPTKPIDNALSAVSPQVLEGEQGKVDLQMTGSRLPEVQDALDYVLKYPYGCVEQTSSSTIPWIVMQGMEEFFPQLQQKDGKAAIQAGVNRLSSMLTERGGLSYWPGGSDPDLFGSAYAGLTLLKARDQGIAVPQKLMDELLVYLSGQLRQLEDEKSDYVLCDSAMALYTLAKGGRAEPAYQNTLYNKREKLPRMAKNFLALAMLISKAPEVQAATLLGISSTATPAKTSQPAKATAPSKSTAKSSKDKAETKAKTKSTTTEVAQTEPSPQLPAPVITTWEHWVGSDVNDALRLIAFTHMGKSAEAQESLNRLLSTRKPDGAWRNTFTNAWALTALAAHQRSQKDLFLPAKISANWGSKSLSLDLEKASDRAVGSFAINPNLSALPLNINMPTGQIAYARVESHSWSKLREFGGENQGYGITREYEEMLSNGTRIPAMELNVGDLVVVTLQITTTGGGRYVAINDPLPAVFESVNPNFESAVNDKARQEAAQEVWYCDHRELRTDRTLFFTDNPPGKGSYKLSYLARVVAEGDVIVPSARIEGMYDPSRYGISATQRVITLPHPAKLAGN